MDSHDSTNFLFEQEYKTRSIFKANTRNTFFDNYQKGGLLQKFPKKLSSLLISLKNRNTYIPFYDSLGLPRINTPSFRFFQFPSRIRGKEKKFEKRGETRAREREREKMEGTGDRGTRTGIYGGEISLRRCPLSYRVSTARRNFCPPGHVQPRNRYAEEKISMFIAMRTSVPRRT